MSAYEPKGMLADEMTVGATVRLDAGELGELFGIVLAVRDYDRRVSFPSIGWIGTFDTRQLNLVTEEMGD